MPRLKLGIGRTSVRPIAVLRLHVWDAADNAPKVIALTQKAHTVSTTTTRPHHCPPPISNSSLRLFPFTALRLSLSRLLLT
jgi:hypothetical protein